MRRSASLKLNVLLTSLLPGHLGFTALMAPELAQILWQDMNVDKGDQEDEYNPCDDAQDEED